MISYLGLIILLFGFDFLLLNVVVVFYIINYVIFKVLLFMVVGIIDYEIGSCDMCLINGMWKYLLYIVVLVIVVFLVMVGVLLLNGFFSKEMFFGEIFS